MARKIKREPHKVACMQCHRSKEWWELKPRGFGYYCASCLTNILNSRKLGNENLGNMDPA